MSDTIVYDARDLVAFSRALRREAPELQKRLRSHVGKAGRVVATKMRADMPHKDSKGGRGVRFSESASSKGAAIIIGGKGQPQSYAYAFGVGNRGPGSFKHPVFGHWSSSDATVMKTSDFVDKNWEIAHDMLRTEVELAVQEVVEALSFESRE